MLGKWIRVIKWSLVLPLFLLVILQLWQICAQTLLKNPVPMLAGYAQVRVLSGSMEPAISVGDRLIIKKAAEYGQNDIITFEEQGVLVTHRIIGTSDSGFITKGDANTAEDDTVIYPEKIVGKVIHIVRRSHLIGFITVVFAGTLLLSAADAEEQKDNRRKGGEKTNV